MTAIASGRTWPGLVPALSTSKWSAASWRRRPSAIWLRAEFPVHRISTFFLSAMRDFLLRVGNHDVRRLSGKRRNEPAEQGRGGDRAGKLRRDEAGRIGRANARESI